MQLKVRPGDFEVEELFPTEGLSTEGPFAIYRVFKQGLTTLEAAARLARAARVRPDAVRFAGLKDRRARTVQWMSVAGGLLADLDGPGLQATFAGRDSEPVRPARIHGNRFALVLRDLSAPESEGMEAAAGELVRHGLPNYFGEQRFGALRAGQGFPFRELLLGRPEEALRLLLAVPTHHDPPRLAALKEELAGAWGDWPRLADLARGTPLERPLRCLLPGGSGWRGALLALPRRERVLQLFAWQSAVWNRALARLLQGRLPASSLLELPGAEGALPAWRTLDPADEAWLADLGLPLPDRRSAPARPEVAAALGAALAEEGLALADLRLEGVRGMELRAEARDALVRPARLALSAPSPDPLFPGRLLRTLELELPRGAYATLAASRLVASRPRGPLDCRA